MLNQRKDVVNELMSERMTAGNWYLLNFSHKETSSALQSDCSHWCREKNMIKSCLKQIQNFWHNTKHKHREIVCLIIVLCSQSKMSARKISELKDKHRIAASMGLFSVWHECHHVATLKYTHHFFYLGEFEAPFNWPPAVLLCNETKSSSYTSASLGPFPEYK